MLPKRKKLMLIYGVTGLAVTLAATAFVIELRRPDETYRPGAEIEGITSDLARSLPDDRPQVTFRDVAAEAGIDFRHFGGTRSTQLPEDMGSGAAWGDYDDDGDVDLFIANIAGPLTLDEDALARSEARSRLYANDGSGHFTDVTDAAGIRGPYIAMGARWGDWNGDGLLDLAITGYGQIALYRNDGEGRFTDVSEASGVSGLRGFWTGLSWADYDGDGDLDLYVCGYVQYTYRPEDVGRGTPQYQAVVPFTLNPSSYPPERNLLLRNDGRGRFEDVAAEAGVENLEGRSLAVAWCDFDEDGLIDLYVANDVSDNVMYKNLGGGRFEDISHEAWVADYRGAMGIAVGDWDADDDQDLFITHWIAQENGLYSNLKHSFGKTMASGEALRFMDVADMNGLGQIALDFIGWGTFFFDYDNDGRPDLFVANGSTFQDPENPAVLQPMTDALFWNAGPDRGFFDVAPVSGEALSKPRVTRGAAFADYDGDGDLDIVTVNHSGLAVLLQNEGGNARHWLHVLVRSETGNRFGVGARVRVRVGDHTQTIHIGSQASYLSQSPYAAHFGLGEAQRVDELEVVFPGGNRVTQKGVAADQTIVVREPSP